MSATQSAPVHILSRKNYNKTNLIVSKNNRGEFVNPAGKKILYGRKNISYRYEDVIGAITLVPPPGLFSLGITENTNDDKTKVTGYSHAICMQDRSAPTEEQVDFIAFVEEIVEDLREILLRPEERKDMGKPKLERAELKKLGNFMSWKEDEDGERVPGLGPILNAKLITRNEKAKVANEKAKVANSTAPTGRLVVDTEYFDDEGNIVDFHTLIKQTHKVDASLWLESIYIGNGVSIQCKIPEGKIEPVGSRVPKALSRPKPNRQIEVQSPPPTENAPTNPTPAPPTEKETSPRTSPVDNEQIGGSAHESEKSESEESPEPQPAQTQPAQTQPARGPVKRLTAKKTAK